MGQSLSRILIHIIFSTKDRYEFLSDKNIRKEMHSFLASMLNKRGAKALLVGGVSDHIHILCLQSKDELIKKSIGESKRQSSMWVKEKGDMLAKFKWQRGYGAFSVSESNIDIVKKYIMNQEEHHKNISFQDEFRTFLNKHNIEYDEEYVWD